MYKRIKSYLFSNKNTKQTIFKNTFWLTASTVVGRFIRALVIIYAARKLGTDGYGIFSYAMSIAAFFSIFSDIGLTGLLTREIAKEPEKKSNYISTVFFLKVGALIVTLFATLFVSPFFIKIEATKSLIPLAALLVLFDSLRVFGFGFARAESKMEKEGIVSIVTDIFITVFSIASLVTSPSPFNLSLMYVLGSFVGTVLIFLTLKKQIANLSGKFDKTLIKPIMNVAVPFAIMGVFSALMINIDMIILGIFKDANELGLYAAAQRPIQLLYVLPTVIATSLFPVISNFIHNKKIDEVKMIVEKSVRITSLAAIPIFIGGILLARPIIFFFFGQQYEGAILSFQILLSTILLVFPGTIVGNTLFSWNLQKRLMLATGLAALSNVILDLLLIPLFGISGSAVATLVSQIISNGITWVSLKKEIDFKIFKHVFPLIVSIISMSVVSLVLSSLGIHVILNIIISGIMYGVMLIVAKEPLIAEVSALIPVVNKLGKKS